MVHCKKTFLLFLSLHSAVHRAEQKGPGIAEDNDFLQALYLSERITRQRLEES